jgi:erythromycin esterase
MDRARLSTAAVRPLRTLDPAAPADDLGWLDEAVGRARVVAIGESAHYNAESYRLRHRVLRRLVEAHGFRAYAMETGFVESKLTDDWVRGAADTPVGEVLATGITSLMGLWLQMREQLEWLREHNRAAAGPVRFFGIDLPGSNASLLPGLDAALAYLAEAEPDVAVDPALRAAVAPFAAPSAFSAMAALGAYGALAPDVRDAVTAGLADLEARMKSARPVTTVEAYDRALRSLRLTIALDQVARALLRGDHTSAMDVRDAAIADTVEWIVSRTDGRVVLAAHNGHIQRGPGTFPGMPPCTPMGVHLAERLGDDYLVIGLTTGHGRTLNTSPDFYAGKLFTDLEPPAVGSLDAVLDASADGPFAVDLRRLSGEDAATVKAAGEQRFGSFYAPIDAARAYDVLVHLPTVTEATLDPEAVAASPDDVRRALSSADDGRPAGSAAR